MPDTAPLPDAAAASLVRAAGLMPGACVCAAITADLGEDLVD
ncbi:MAG: hypothetical protein WDM77_14465 [Steroidobacteraceae bacterium]